jgi:hypothetical protein
MIVLFDLPTPAKNWAFLLYRLPILYHLTCLIPYLITQSAGLFLHRFLYQLLNFSKDRATQGT